MSLQAQFDGVHDAKSKDQRAEQDSPLVDQAVVGHG